MIEKLGRQLGGFPGAPNWAQCFMHILNLVVKSILNQFEVSGARPRLSVMDEQAEELRKLAGNLDKDDLKHAEEDYMDEPEEDDNKDGWIDEWDEMADEDVEEMKEVIQPIRFAPDYHICHCKNAGLQYANQPVNTQGCLGFPHPSIISAFPSTEYKGRSSHVQFHFCVASRTCPSPQQPPTLSPLSHLSSLTASTYISTPPL